MKKILTLILAAAMVLSALPMAFAATMAGGTMENITWNLDGDGTLTISGTGEMPSIGDEEDYPWYTYRAAVKHVVFGEGLEDVASSAFEFVYDNLETVVFSSTINSIGTDAFCNLSGLKTVNIPGNVKLIGWEAFAGCKNLATVVLNEGTEIIYPDAFRSCNKLTSVVVPNSVEKVWQRAFAECSGLQDITILNKNCEIVEYADENAPYYTIPVQTTIHGYTGSTAEAYAKQYNRTFVAIEENTTPANDYLGGLKTFIESITAMLKPMLDNLMNTLKQLFANSNAQQPETPTDPATETPTQPTAGTADLSALLANLMPILTNAFNSIIALLQSANAQPAQPAA